MVKNEPMKWTLCKDKLPPLGTSVLVTIWGSDVIVVQHGETLWDAIKRVDNEVRYTTVATYDKDSDSQGNEWFDWFGADGFPMIVKPVAWAYLPFPYQGKTHDNC